MVNKLTNRMTWPQLCETTAKRLGRGNKFIDWMLTKKEVSYVFDYGLFEHCYEIVKNKLQKNNDHFTVVIGKEGVGKSTLASQISAIVSPTFNKTNVCFRAIQLIDNMNDCNPGDTIWVDEGAIVLLSTNVNTKEGKLLTQLFSIIRSRRFHFVVCIPKFKSLNNYIREHRIDSLIHVTEKGRYTLYTEEGINTIMEQIRKGIKFQNISIPTRDKWKGYYTKKIPTINDFSPDVYEGFKNENVAQFIGEAKSITDKLSPVIGEEEENLTAYVDLADAKKVIKLDNSTYIRMIKDGRVEGKKMGSKWFLKRESLEKLAE